MSTEPDDLQVVPSKQREPMAAARPRPSTVLMHRSAALRYPPRYPTFWVSRNLSKRAIPMAIPLCATDTCGVGHTHLNAYLVVTHACQLNPTMCATQATTRRLLSPLSVCANNNPDPKGETSLRATCGASQDSLTYYDARTTHRGRRVAIEWPSRRTKPPLSSSTPGQPPWSRPSSQTWACPASRAST